MARYNVYKLSQNPDTLTFRGSCEADSVDQAVQAWYDNRETGESSEENIYAIAVSNIIGPYGERIIKELVRIPVGMPPPDALTKKVFAGAESD